MNVTAEERQIIEVLRTNYAINLSQAFKLFLRKMLDNLKEKENAI